MVGGGNHFKNLRTLMKAWGGGGCGGRWRPFHIAPTHPPHISFFTFSNAFYWCFTSSQWPQEMALGCNSLFFYFGAPLHLLITCCPFFYSFFCVCSRLCTCMYYSQSTGKQFLRRVHRRCRLVRCAVHAILMALKSIHDSHC